jgi:hypothetical protein
MTMALEIDQLIDYLTAEELHFSMTFPERDFVVRLPSHRYRSHVTDRNEITLIVRLDPKIPYVQIYAPSVLSIDGAAYPDAAVRACLEFGWRGRPVQTAMDDRDGELRMSIDIPVFDGTVTKEQVTASLYRLATRIDEFAPIFEQACSTGEIDWSRFGEQDSELDAMELADMMERVGGVEGLRTLLRTSGFGEGGTQGKRKSRRTREGGA